jgi:hypothetical protein
VAGTTLFKQVVFSARGAPWAERGVQRVVIGLPSAGMFPANSTVRNRNASENGGGVGNVRS